MLDCEEVKQAMSEVGLPNLIHRMWTYCESDTQLIMTCLSTLITYTHDSATGMGLRLVIYLSMVGLSILYNYLR